MVSKNHSSYFLVYIGLLIFVGIFISLFEIILFSGSIEYSKFFYVYMIIGDIVDYPTMYDVLVHDVCYCVCEVHVIVSKKNVSGEVSQVC